MLLSKAEDILFCNFVAIIIYYCHMEKNEQLLEKILRAHGYSVTQPRRAVFKLLLSQPPQAMRDLIGRADSQIDRVSIYRIINLFETLGISKRITIGWKYKIELSDIFLVHHHHISCLRCSKIVAVKDSTVIENEITRLSADHGFTLTSHQLELQGICETCMKDNVHLENIGNYPYTKNNK